jgi:hypothetical protein
MASVDLEREDRLMKRTVWLTVIGLVISVSSVHAQTGRPFGGAPNPPYSPYLNLVRPGANPAINYYGLVRPQNDFARSVQSLQGQLNSTQQSMADQAGGDGLITGHAIYFMNYGGYFMNTGAGPTGATTPTRTAIGANAVAQPRYRR